MDKKTTIELIKIYQSHRLLWDTSERSFYNKKLRESAWKHISCELNIPVKDVKNKITNLRGILRKERYKSRQSQIKDGSPYKSKWFLFKHLSFLDNKTTQADTEPSTSRVPLETSDANEPMNNTRNRLARKIPKMVSRTKDYFQESHDPYDTFGRLVASELRKYDNHTLAHVKKAIMDIIFKADIDSLPEFKIEENCED